VKIKVYDDAGTTRFKMWVDGTLKSNRTDSSISYGGVAFAGDKPLFDNLKVG
jgi:hypothetical protein